MPYKKKDAAEKEKLSSEAYEEIITTHMNADFDALASMIAAKKLYPNATLVFPGSQEKNLRNFFLHSTSYLFDFVKLKQIDFDKIKRLILVDTRQKRRIGKFSSLIQKKDIDIHIYDHHPNSKDDIKGHFELVRKVGSTTALLTALIREKGLNISPDEATIMCLGIHEDTGSFTFPSTTPDDYDAAAWLTAKGADHNIIADMLTRELTAEQVWLLNDLTQAATTHVINGIEIVISKVIRDEYMGDFAVIVHKFMEMENLNVVFALAQMEDRIYLVARSRIEEVNVAEIALDLGGGGHPQAASASIKNKTLNQVEKSLQEKLRSRINPQKKAKDMMSSPTIHISPDDSVEKAGELMTRYNINVLMVMDDKGVLMGYVTRQIVEKAVFFGLQYVKVKEYMNIEFLTTHPDSSLREVQELIIRNKLRVLPVVDKKKVLGVITRTDLLNILLGEPIIPEFLYDAKHDAHLAKQKDLIHLLRNRLPENIINLLKDIGQIADMLEYNAYMVGGMVRDILLDRENLDLDIVVEGDGIKFAQEFAHLHGCRVRSHPKFGTAVLIFPDGFKVDVATARMEYYESPAALPIVEMSSLKLDLYRRDFTINTLAIKLNKKDFGRMIDYFGGQNDIKEKVIRVLHNLSFVEDPTRVLRAIRFEQRFGFKIGKLTLFLIRNAVKINYFKDLASHRLLMEVKLILKEHDPIGAIHRMNEFNLLQFISPEIKFTEGLKALLDEIRKVIHWYNLLYLEDAFEPWKVYWYGMTDNLKTASLLSLSRDMGLADQGGRITACQKEKMGSILARLQKFNEDNYQLYTLLESCDTESLLYLMAKTNSQKAKRLISNYFTKIKDTKIHLNGKDLLKLGFKQGPLFKKILDRVLEARMNGLIKTRDDEIRLVKKEFQPS